MLATAGLTEKDVKPVLVPNVCAAPTISSSGAADMFMFAFGAPKVREVDATVGGMRVLEIAETPGWTRRARSPPTAICSTSSPARSSSASRSR